MYVHQQSQILIEFLKDDSNLFGESHILSTEARNLRNAHQHDQYCAHSPVTVSSIYSFHF